LRGARLVAIRLACGLLCGAGLGRWAGGVGVRVGGMAAWCRVMLGRVAWVGGWVGAKRGLWSVGVGVGAGGRSAGVV